MKKETLLCLITCIAFCGCAFGRKKATLEDMTAKNIGQPEARDTTDSKGYLASGPTIRVETETTEPVGTIIEQLENTSMELQENKELLSSFEKEIEILKTSKKILQAELKDNNEKLVLAQQMLIENEILNNEVERLKMDLSALQKEIKQLNGNLLNSQISEVKTKQELVSARIQHLQEKKR